jgi:hypothetical protein
LLGMHFILIHVLLSFSRVMIIFGFQCFWIEMILFLVSSIHLTR